MLFMYYFEFLLLNMHIKLYLDNNIVKFTKKKCDKLYYK